MQLAQLAPSFAAAGAQLVAISVDDVGANAALTAKLRLPFPVLSDPDGEGAIKPFGVWHAEEGIARAAVVALAPDGGEVFRHVGIDYADRPVELEVLAAVRALGLPAREDRPGVHPHAEPRPSPRAYAREALLPYFRGVRGAAKALHGRTGEEHAARVQALAERFVEALEAQRS